jgi:hypothetical protein
MASCLDGNAAAVQRLHLRRKICERFFVGDGHPGSKGIKRTSCRNSAPGHAHHRYPFILKVHHHVSSIRATIHCPIRGDHGF